jgi:hypothetical protein
LLRLPVVEALTTPAWAYSLKRLRRRHRRYLLLALQLRLVRDVDRMDSYMAPSGRRHPSDNFGAVLAAAEQAGTSGADFMLAAGRSYESTVPVHSWRLGDAQGLQPPLFGLSPGP